jgi:hypothetical protein
MHIIFLQLLTYIKQKDIWNSVVKRCYSVLMKNLSLKQSSSDLVWLPSYEEKLTTPKRLWPPRYEEKLATPKRHRLEFWDTQLKVWGRQAIIFRLRATQRVWWRDQPCGQMCLYSPGVDFINTSTQFSIYISLNCITKHILTLILLMWRIGWSPNSIPIYIQQDATLHSLFVSGNCSTCFGWYFHPSSGANTTGSTASGICHTVTAICRYRGRVGTGLSVLWVAYATTVTKIRR